MTRRHPRTVFLEPAIELRYGIEAADDGEIRGGIEAGDQLTALRRVVLVHDDDRHVLHVSGRRVAEEGELDDRRDENDAEQPRVLPQLEQFLPHQVPEAAHFQAHSRFSRIAASPITATAKIASAASCDAIGTMPTPLRRMPRSATRKYRAGTI